MVVVTVVTKENPHKCHFSKRIENANNIRLLSCSFYNNWFNLPHFGSLNFYPASGGKKTEYWQEGHYNIDNISEKLLFQSAKYEYGLQIIKNSPDCLFEIYNPSHKIFLDDDLQVLFGGAKKFEGLTKIYSINTPTAYLISCDLVDQDNNFFNGNKSKNLAFFGVKGPCHQQYTYSKKEPNPFIPIDLNEQECFDSLTISVKDEKNRLFDFQGSDIVYEIEFI